MHNRNSAENHIMHAAVASHVPCSHSSAATPRDILDPARPQRTYPCKEPQRTYTRTSTPKEMTLCLDCVTELLTIICVGEAVTEEREE